MMGTVPESDVRSIYTVLSMLAFEDLFYHENFFHLSDFDKGFII